MNRLSLREWMPILPWPPWPLAGHAEFGQNVVVGSMFVLRVALGNVPRGVCLDPHFHCKRTIPRLSVELPDLAFEKIQCFPFYTYDEDGTNRQENITDWALEQFRAHYSDTNI